MIIKRIFVFLFFITVSMSFLTAQENADNDVTDIARNNDSAEALIIPAGEPDTVVKPVMPTAMTADTAPEDAGNAESPVTAAIPAKGKMYDFLVRLGKALAIVAGLALLIWLIWLLFKRLSEKLISHGGKKIKPLIIKKLKVLSTKQIINFILFLLRILKYATSAFLLFLALPIVFSLFPATKNLASTLFGYILHPLKNILFGTIKYIPNLFTIIVIVVITNYIIKALKFFSTQIAKGKLILRGFYADWAEPTFNILRVLLWAFTIAIAYPYLPGSESRVFQGVSVFVGIIFSLGSSTAVGNLVAGLVITYMRPFKIGDRVKINESIGFVVAKNPMVVRLRTHKNEYVTFPNTIILSSGIINYNTSSAEDAEGLILHTEITYGYTTPWETIHEILINAALATNYIQKKPKPYVLQTVMDDFYVHYEINCYTKEVDKVPLIYTLLHENIQNGFREAGLDMTAPHYEISLTKIDWIKHEAGTKISKK